MIKTPPRHPLLGARVDDRRVQLSAKPKPKPNGLFGFGFLTVKK